MGRRSDVTASCELASDDICTNLDSLVPSATALPPEAVLAPRPATACGTDRWVCWCVSWKRASAALRPQPGLAQRALRNPVIEPSGKPLRAGA